MLSTIFYVVLTISVAVNLHPPLQSPILIVFLSGGLVMKKICLVLAVFFLMSSFVFSESIDLGKFPRGNGWIKTGMQFGNLVQTISDCWTPMDLKFSISRIKFQTSKLTLGFLKQRFHLPVLKLNASMYLQKV